MRDERPVSIALRGTDRGDGVHVSFVIAAFNAEKTIVRTLGSISKGMPDDCEVIVVDDGSSDATVSLVKDFAATHADVKIKLLLQSENMGVSAARNRGLSEARGFWCTFVDADDELSPDFYRCGYRYLLSDSSDIILFSYVENQNGEIQERRFVDRKITIIDEFSRRDLVCALLNCAPACFAVENTEMLGGVCGTYYRKDFIDRVNVQFDEECCVMEDLLFKLKAITRAAQVALYPEFAYKYNIASGSAMRGWTKRSDDGLFILVGKVSEELCSAGMMTSEVEVALRRCVLGVLDTLFARRIKYDKQLTYEELRREFDCERIGSLISLLQDRNGELMVNRLDRAAKIKRWLIANRRSLLLYLIYRAKARLERAQVGKGA